MTLRMFVRGMSTYVSPGCSVGGGGVTAGVTVGGALGAGCEMGAEAWDRPAGRGTAPIGTGCRFFSLMYFSRSLQYQCATQLLKILVLICFCYITYK